MLDAIFATLYIELLLFIMLHYISPQPHPAAVREREREKEEVLLLVTMATDMLSSILLVPSAKRLFCIWDTGTVLHETCRS